MKKKIVDFLASEIVKRDWTDDQIDGLKKALFPGTHQSEFEPAYKQWQARNPQKDINPMSEAEIDQMVEMGL